MSQDRIPTSSVVFSPIPTCPSVSWSRVYQREASHSFSTMVRGAIQSTAIFSILVVICTLHLERTHVENDTLELNELSRLTKIQFRVWSRSDGQGLERYLEFGLAPSLLLLSFMQLPMYRIIPVFFIFFFRYSVFFVPLLPSIFWFVGRKKKKADSWQRFKGQIPGNLAYKSRVLWGGTRFS